LRGNVLDKRDKNERMTLRDLREAACESKRYMKLA
jgi:hypothetical protein